MRIAFTGSSGTGKSTLARFVADHYGIPLNPIGSRSVALEMGFSSPYDVDKAGKRAEFQRRLQSEKVAWETKHDMFVTDRSTLDELAYTSLHDVQTAVSPDYYRTALEHMNRYTLVVRCPVATFCSLDNDPKRLNDIRYQQVFDALLHGLLMTVDETLNATWLDMFEARLDARKALLRDVLEVEV
jgi:predicted ATPase